MNYKREKVLWSAITPQMVILLISIVWIWVLPKSNPIRYFNFSTKVILEGALTGVCLSLAGYLVYKLAGKIKRFSVLTELFDEVLSPVFKDLMLIDFLLLSLTSSFCEEILFRGLLLPSIGIILSSVAFGLLHLPGMKYWFYAVWATCSGLLLGWLFIFSGSLWLPITAHAVNNFIGLVLLKNLQKKKKKL
ncbi:MAG: CPBP family intramembrane metalloprotease [Candidatus Melainabacteria bacterium]|nr:CPBP family intramembrane metalloprotease [Candidatus Melainabacteria bacterium]